MSGIRDQFYAIKGIIRNPVVETPTVAGGGAATDISVDVDTVIASGVHGLGLFVRAIGGDLYVDLMAGESAAVTARAALLLEDGKSAYFEFDAEASKAPLVSLAAAGGGVTAAVTVVGLKRQNRVGQMEAV
jgi:hypothetical protein